MTKPKTPHTIGCFYRYWVKLPGISAARTGQGMPAMRTERTGQLIDKRNNGVLIMQVDYVTWNYPTGWAGADAVAHMMSPNKKAVTKTRLERIRTHQVIGYADKQPANRVPHLPKDAA